MPTAAAAPVWLRPVRSPHLKFGMKSGLLDAVTAVRMATLLGNDPFKTEQLPLCLAVLTVDGT